MLYYNIVNIIYHLYIIVIYVIVFKDFPSCILRNNSWHSSGLVWGTGNEPSSGTCKASTLLAEISFQFQEKYFSLINIFNFNLVPLLL